MKLKLYMITFPETEESEKIQMADWAKSARDAIRNSLKKAFSNRIKSLYIGKREFDNWIRCYRYIVRHDMVSQFCKERTGFIK